MTGNVLAAVTHQPKVGLLDRLLGRNLDTHPAPWRGWEDHDAARRLASAQVLFDRVGARLGLEPSRVVEHHGEPCWIGELRGIRFRAMLSSSSGQLEVELKYRATGMRSIDLQGDEAVIELAEPPWDEHERRIFVDTHVFLEGSSAADEHRAFVGLPAAVRERTLGAMRAAVLRYLRSRDGELDAHSEHGILEGGDPVAIVVEVLGAAIDLTEARLAIVPGVTEVSSPDRPLAGYRRLEGEPRWALLIEQLQPRVAAALRGTELRAVVKRNDDAVELRWVVDATPVRIVADASWNHLEVDARVAHPSVALDLSRETQACAEHDVGDAADPWTDVDPTRVFVAPRVCVEGTAAEVRAQVAALRGLPGALSTELLHELGEGALEWLVLDEGRLHTVLAELDATTDADVEAAVRIGELLGRLAQALPRGPETAGRA